MSRQISGAEKVLTGTTSLGSRSRTASGFGAFGSELGDIGGVVIVDFGPEVRETLGRATWESE